MAEPLVSARELVELQEGSTPPVVLDATAHLDPPTAAERFPVRSGAADWAAAHIPGSRHLDLVEAVSDPAASYHFSVAEPARLSAALAAAGVTAGRPVVCYDSADGLWAARLWWVLRDAGLAATVLDGGLAAWRAEGLPVETGDRAEHPTSAAPPVDGARRGWAGLAEVAALAAGDPSELLVCALPEGQFRGTSATRYPRSGHIPHSRNLPAGALRDPEGKHLSPARLRAITEPVVGPPGERPLTLYCGAGISAAGLALGLVAAGYSDIRIYDGSLEEWTTDPGRPLVGPEEPTA